MLTVYSKNSCSQCIMLKNLLKAKQISHKTLMLDIDYTLEELQTKLETAGAESRSFPVVFEGDKFIGGLDAVKKHIVQ